MELNMMKKVVSVLLCSIALYGCGTDNEIVASNYSGQDLHFFYSKRTPSELNEMQKQYIEKRQSIPDEIRLWNVEYDDSLSPEANIAKLQQQLEQRINSTKEQEELVQSLYPKSNFQKSEELIETQAKVNETFKLAAINYEILVEERYIRNMYRYSYNSGKCKRGYRTKYTATSASDVGCAYAFIDKNLLRQHPQIEADVKASLVDLVELYREEKDQHTLDSAKYHKERKALTKQIRLADLKFGSQSKLGDAIERIEHSIDNSLLELRYVIEVESFKDNALKLEDFISENYKAMYVVYKDGQEVLFQSIQAFGEDVDINEFKIADDSSWIKTMATLGEGESMNEAVEPVI